MNGLFEENDNIEKVETMNLNIQEIEKDEIDSNVEISNISEENNLSDSEKFGARIITIGIGGGGTNTINCLAKDMNHPSVTLMAANTDKQHLSISNAHRKILLGERITKGLGAGMKPEVGEKAAVESSEEIRNALKDGDMVFIAAGLGGGTGTGAAPVIAEIAKELGALTVAVVTKPFRFEGSKRMRLAEESLAKLRKVCDCLVVIPNDKISAIMPKGSGVKESFKLVDDVLSKAADGISGVILNSGEGDINIDFADFQTVMSHKGLALMGIGESQSDTAALDAINEALHSPLFNDLSIKGAMGVVVHFDMHKDYPMEELLNAMNKIEEIADPDADVLFGTNTNKDIPVGHVKVTIVATGFEREEVSMTLSAPSQTQAVKLSEYLKASGEDDIELTNLDIPTFQRQKRD